MRLRFKIKIERKRKSRKRGMVKVSWLSVLKKVYSNVPMYFFADILQVSLMLNYSYSVLYFSM